MKKTLGTSIVLLNPSLPRTGCRKLESLWDAARHCLSACVVRRMPRAIRSLLRLWTATSGALRAGCPRT